MSRCRVVLPFIKGTIYFKKSTDSNYQYFEYLMALPKRFEPLTYRLGGGRSIRAELWEQQENYIILPMR